VANISQATHRVWTGGDLPSDLGEEAMLASLGEIQTAGITQILDNRIEWSDKAFVEAHAAIAYAADALDWWHRMTATPAPVVNRQRAEVAAWYRRNPIDMVRIIRTIRSQEDNGGPLSA
jgi:hypothetical protein